MATGGRKSLPDSGRSSRPSSSERQAALPTFFRLLQTNEPFQPIEDPPVSAINHQTIANKESTYVHKVTSNYALTSTYYHGQNIILENGHFRYLNTLIQVLDLRTILHPQDRLSISQVNPLTRYLADCHQLASILSPDDICLSFGVVLALGQAHVSLAAFSLTGYPIINGGMVALPDPPGFQQYQTVCYRCNWRLTERDAANAVLGVTPLLPITDTVNIVIPPPGRFRFHDDPLLGQLAPQGPLVSIPYAVLQDFGSPFADFPRDDFQRVFTGFRIQGSICPGLPRPLDPQPIPHHLFKIHTYGRACDPVDQYQDRTTDSPTLEDRLSPLSLGSACTPSPRPST